MRSNQGITLIALIITVIIMIILAGIGINFIIGEHGILKRAEEGTKIYQNSANNEMVFLNDVDKKIENIIDRIDGNEQVTGEEFRIKFDSVLDESKDEDGFFKEGVKVSVYKYADIEANGNLKISKEFEGIQLLTVDHILDEYVEGSYNGNPLDVELEYLNEKGQELVNIIERNGTRPILTTTTKNKEKKEIVFQSPKLDNILWFVVVENDGFLGEFYDYIVRADMPCIGFGIAKNGKGKTLEAVNTQYDENTLEFTLTPLVSQEIKTAGLKIVNTVNNKQDTEEAIFVYEIKAQKNGEIVYKDVASIKQTIDGKQEIIIDGKIPVGSQVTVKEVYTGGKYDCTNGETKTYTAVDTNIDMVEFINENNGKTIQSEFAIVDCNYDEAREGWNYNIEYSNTELIHIEYANWTAYITVSNEQSEVLVRLKNYTVENKDISDDSGKWEAKEDGYYYSDRLNPAQTTDEIRIRTILEDENVTNFKLIVVVEFFNEV